MTDLYHTEIRAIRHTDGELVTYCGPNVPGISFADAQEYCERNGLGYCKVVGLLISEIPCKPGTLEPDWDNAVHYDNNRSN